MANKPDALYHALRKDLSGQLSPSLVSLLGKGVIPPDVSIKDFACLALSNSFPKKFVAGKKSDADSKALAKFLHCNTQAETWTLSLESTWEEELFGCFKSAVYDFFNPGGYTMNLWPDNLASKGGFGPGASVGARAQDFYTKFFDSPLSGTSQSLYEWYRRFTDRIPTWQLAEKARSDHHGSFVKCSGNRISFAAKTTEISRVICVEPPLNMWFQFAAKDAIEFRLKTKFGINLARQPDFNRDLARLASLGWGYVTIDLESASDSMSTRMLQEVLPDSVFKALSLYRSPETSLPDGTVARLSIFSSMGNAFTFPLQTALFCCVVSAVYRYLSIPIDKPNGEWHGNFGVFGDDIICLDTASRLVVRLLNVLGFRVNLQKSFFEGPFYESCGEDYFHGHNVRGVYLKSLDPHSLIATLNLCTSFTARTGVELPHLCRALRGFLRGRLNVVPRWENDDAGWKVPISFIKPRLDRFGSYAYMAYRPRPSSIKFDHEARTVRVPKRGRRRTYNEDGYLISALAGVARDDLIYVRHDKVKYQRSYSVAPNWDSVSNWTPSETTRSPLTWVSWAKWRRWETAFYLNL